MSTGLGSWLLFRACLFILLASLKLKSKNGITLKLTIRLNFTLRTYTRKWLNGYIYVYADVELLVMLECVVDVCCCCYV